MSLANQVTALRRQRERRSDDARRLETSAQSDRKKIAALAEKIKGGSSTGDPITDFVIVAHHTLGGQTEAKYRLVAAMLQGHGSDLILLVSRSEHYPGCTGLGYEPQDRDYVLEERVFLGYLERDQLIFDPEGRCVVPTARYVQASGWWGGGKSGHLTQGPLRLSWWENISRLNEPLQLRNYTNWRYDKARPLELEIVVGQAEIEKWAEQFKEFSQNHVREQIEKMIDRVMVLVA